MPEELPRIQITLDEVKDPRVDKLVAENAPRGPLMPREPKAPPKVPFYYNPMIVYAVAGGIAAAAVFFLLEGNVREIERETMEAARQGRQPQLSPGLMLSAIGLFPLMASMMGLMLAITDGLLSRNFVRAAISGAVGLGTGFLASLLGLFCSGLIRGFIMDPIIAATITPGTNPTDISQIHGVTFFLMMVERAMGWTLIAAGMGVGQGIAVKSKKLVTNGLIGGLIGGFLGGLLFDPIDKLLHGTFLGETGGPSRFCGFMAIGLAVGFFVGLVESISKDAWLYMKAGPLAGKQFVIYNDPTVLGSSPKCEVYLFKDAAIEPRHCEIRAVGTRYQIKDMGTRQGVYVNGQKVESRMLQTGDTIVLGETVLEYAEREKK